MKYFAPWRSTNLQAINAYFEKNVITRKLVWTGTRNLIDASQARYHCPSEISFLPN